LLDVVLESFGHPQGLVRRSIRPVVGGMEPKASRPPWRRVHALRAAAGSIPGAARSDARQKGPAVGENNYRPVSLTGHRLA
jgi:hypothetical protein